VRAAQPQSPERGGVRAQLVGHQQFRCKALLLEKLAHQPQRRPAVAAALNQHVEHLALVIDGSPEIHPLAGDPHHHLVQMPSVAWPRATPAQPSGNHRSELQHPTPHRFVGEFEPTLGEQILHVAVAQGEAKVEPNRVLDNRRRKAVAAIRERDHGERLSYPPLALTPVSVTWPAGWTTPLDEFLDDPKKTPDDFDPEDFLPGTLAAFRDANGRPHAIPWIADAQQAGCTRYDLVEKAGLKLPDSFDEMASMLKALKAQGGPTPFVTENHYGWQFPPYLLAYGGLIFRHAPDDLHPMLDTPEAIHAAEFFSNMLREYGPDGVLSYTYEQTAVALRDGTINYSTTNEAFLVRMAEPDSKVKNTCALSMMPRGPAGRFPNVASHGWGIPAAAKQKDASWEFITWAMSKKLLTRMFNEKGYSSTTRESIIKLPEFYKKLLINGFDEAKIYEDTLRLAGEGYTVYRTVPPYPPVDRELDIAIQTIVSQQMSAKDAMQQAQQNSLRALQRAGVKL
jgi:multiple sugar transport system substrate-binding protein